MTTRYPLAEPSAFIESAQVPLTISLLGPPRIAKGGEVASPPRGRKAWGLLAYVMLASAPVPRERLASLLFAEADDPMGALRWNLAELRRVLGPSVELGGDLVRLSFPPDAVADVHVLVRATWVEAARTPSLGRELLEGVDVRDSPAFETWLLAERRRFAGISASILREAATARLAAGEARAAIDLASRLVAIEDFDEEAHALLIRAYAASGDLPMARRQLRASIELFRRDLGVEPSATLVRALDTSISTPVGAPRASRTATAALIDAGRAAVNAGAVDAGLQTLRRAGTEAHQDGDPILEARALLALGVALVHGLRGRDGEGATVLHTALGLAEGVGDAPIVTEACRELGYIEFLRARYDRAEAWLRRAMKEAPTEPERAAALGVLGAVVSDRGRTAEAVDMLREAAAVGQRAQKPKIEGWARAFLGRAHVLRGEPGPGREALARAIEICQLVGWVSFRPWPLGLLGSVELGEGFVDVASEAFETTFAIGCQIGDPCWEAMGARGIGLVRTKRGELESGFEWLADARARSIRIPDAYVWIEALCLDTLAEAGIAHGHPAVRGWIGDLEALAARTGMREMLVRAYLHRGKLGDESARDAAGAFAAEVDNPEVVAALQGVPVAG